MFHLFAGNNYYPDSGLGDYVQSFEEEDEAQIVGANLCKPPDDDTYGHLDWWAVISDHGGRLTEVSRGYSK